jgi:acyl-CoA reductase-like NAD-dependent aldehyde dehydrogenase
MSNILEILSPYDLSTIDKLPMQNAVDVEQSLDTASRLFLDPETWLQPNQRVQILEKAASIVEGRVDELTKTAARLSLNLHVIRLFHAWHW